MTQDIDDDDRVTASASSNAEEEGEEMGKVFTEVSIQVLYCTVLYCTVLYCTVLYCTVRGAAEPRVRAAVARSGQDTSGDNSNPSDVPGIPAFPSWECNKCPKNATLDEIKNKEASLLSSLQV